MHGCVMRHSGRAQHSRTRSSPGAAREGVVRVRACLAAGAGAVAGGRCCDAGCADRPGQPVVAFLSLLAEARTNACRTTGLACNTLRAPQKQPQDVQKARGHEIRSRSVCCLGWWCAATAHTWTN